MNWPPIARDPRFFRRSGQHNLATVATPAGATPPPAQLMLTGVAPLQTAGPHQVSFFDNRRYVSALSETSAGAVIVHPEMVEKVPAGAVPIPVHEPYVAWARVAALFHPLPPVVAEVHLSAVVAVDAKIEASAEI